MEIALKKKNIVVVAPHPDDETLGCGGTLLKHLSNKDQIYWCMMTYGNSKMGHDKKHYKKWDSIIESVNKEYQSTKFFNLKFPSGELDNVGNMEIITKIKKVINEVRPQIIYLNHYGDVHTDHRYTFDCVMSSVKNFNAPFIDKIMTYETISETDFSPVSLNQTFKPNIFVDISDYFEQKIKIMNNYKSEVMQKPFPRSIRSIEALAILRGSRIGVNYAEAFQLEFEKK